ncbi:hypothetical protein SAMD00019534_090650 [Acytostelium subglobosum LB1]|uniref:hypothetical protein n=1 Tax=Acytostelium subglobosum LB1 TaxID=1410327 RepID=UPI00064500AB|nr:hypothetical protein SAMD00019534_090650 [Acytostelium subglobosum LB1]GAM25890.1 hypothetical protein SAMD00019534_090650 [Acytostelium subglobosum LB1]|eukprot:XP_012750933.1 hypothetical protein SAMD00019534_090650 [Acytostelium subglobosum LB1]
MTVEDAKRNLQALITRDHQLDIELKQYIQMKDDLERQMECFDKDVPDYLSLLLSKSNQLTNTISSTCSLAELLSSKVKNLDRIRERIKETLKKVDDIVDLKNCIEGIQKSLELEDFEAAANHVHRYLNIDQAVLEPSSIEMLNNAQQRLSSMIEQKYKLALSSNNHSDVLRFCKLYIQLQKEEEGVEKYCNFLKLESEATLDVVVKQYQTSIGRPTQPKQQQQPQQQTPGGISATTILTKILQHFASTIEDYLEVVRKEFGIRLCPLFLRLVSHHTDNYTGRVFALFSEQFSIARCVSDISSTNKEHQQQHHHHQQQQHRVDPRNFAQLLDEIVMMSKATRFYERYLINKERIIKESIKKEIELMVSGGGQSSTNKHIDTLDDRSINEEVSGVRVPGQPHSTLEQLEKVNLKTTMYSTQTKSKMNDLLGSYLLLEEYFMVESSHKAVQLDEHSDDSLNSSMVDYIFFVLQKSLQRSIDSFNMQTLNVITNCMIKVLIRTQDTLQRMFREQIQKATSKANIDYKESMIVLNNIETSGEYILKLKKELETRCEKMYTLAEEKDQVALQVAEFSGVAKSYNRLLQEEIDQIFRSIQPKLKNVLFLFTSVNYEIGQEEYDNNEVNDPFVYPFTVEISQFLQPFEDHLTTTNYDSIVHLTIGFLVKKIENGIYLKHFTQIGALQFGKDIRAIFNFFAKLCKSTIRDKFSKLNQIVSLLTLERLSEIEEFWSDNSSMLSWKLSPTEVKKLLACRTDFQTDQIHKIKI